MLSKRCNASFPGRCVAPQDWVIDAIDDLNIEGLISDYDTAELKRKLDPHLWQVIKQDEEENNEQSENNAQIQKPEREWKCCNCETNNVGESGYCPACGHPECNNCPNLV